MKRISQDLGAMMGGGLETMPTAGPPGGPAGGEGAPAQPQFKVIHSPLDSLGKILADVDIKTFLQNNFGDDPDTLAHKIWVMYGGSEDEISPGKKGARQDKPASGDMMQQQKIQDEEYNATRNARWRRLPLGVSIEEITSTQALSNAIMGGFSDLAKSFSKPAQAKHSKFWLKLANIADERGQYLTADKLDMILSNVYTS